MPSKDYRPCRTSEHPPPDNRTAKYLCYSPCSPYQNYVLVRQPYLEFKLSLLLSCAFIAILHHCDCAIIHIACQYHETLTWKSVDCSHDLAIQSNVRIFHRHCLNSSIFNACFIAYNIDKPVNTIRAGESRRHLIR